MESEYLAGKDQTKTKQGPFVHSRSNSTICSGSFRLWTLAENHLHVIAILAALLLLGVPGKIRVQLTAYRKLMLHKLYIQRQSNRTLQS